MYIYYMNILKSWLCALLARSLHANSLKSNLLRVSNDTYFQLVFNVFNKLDFSFEIGICFFPPDPEY